MKGADRAIYNALDASGLFSVALTCLVVSASTEDEGLCSKDKVTLTPVTMHDFFPESHEKPVFPCKEAILVTDTKGRTGVNVLWEESYIEFTGNEAQLGHYAYYFACFVVALKKND